MRIAALDIGDTRTGVALADARGRIATPFAVFETRELISSGTKLRQFIDDYEIEHFVVGLPLSLSGEEGSQARHVRALAAKIFKACNYSADDDACLEEERVTFYDERLSSVAAKQALAEHELSEREMRGKVDKIAAALFLQSYLDAHNA